MNIREQLVQRIREDYSQELAIATAVDTTWTTVADYFREIQRQIQGYVQHVQDVTLSIDGEQIFLRVGSNRMYVRKRQDSIYLEIPRVKSGTYVPATNGYCENIANPGEFLDIDLMEEYLKHFV